ncbi:MAG: DNA-3-methyladenine glycosylase 2 family protein, partial [Acidimicrobiales bacterium]
MPDASATFTPAHPVDLRLTLGALSQGPGDPMLRLDATGAWRASRTPEGPVTLRLRSTGGGGVIRAEAWGPGASWAVAQAPELVGGGDAVEGFDALARLHPLVHDLHRRHRRLRLPRTRQVFEAMVVTICAQKVTGLEAHRSFRSIVQRWGEPAPVPLGVSAAPRLRLLPEPALLARQPSWAFHPMGLERKRAETVLRVAAAAGRLEAVAAMDDRVAARLRLRAVPGVGVWTSAEVALVAL